MSRQKQVIRKDESAALGHMEVSLWPNLRCNLVIGLKSFRSLIASLILVRMEVSSLSGKINPTHLLGA